VSTNYRCRVARGRDCEHTPVHGTVILTRLEGVR